MDTNMENQMHTGGMFLAGSSGVMEVLTFQRPTELSYLGALGVKVHSLSPILSIYTVQCRASTLITC